MPDFVLYLGGVGFSDMEVPETIEESLSQALHGHKYPGGTRTWDAMGPDRGPITFAGVLMDQTAEARRNQLETMAAAGEAVQLTYASRVLQVVVRNLRTSFHRFWHIDYHIELEVVTDLSQPSPSPAADIVSTIQDDMALAVSNAADLASAALVEAIDAANMAMATIALLADASPAELATIIGMVDLAGQDAAILSGAYDGQIALAADPTKFGSGIDPGAMQTNVLALQGLTGKVPVAFDTVARLGRIGKNLQQMQG